MPNPFLITKDKKESKMLQHRVQDGGRVGGCYTHFLPGASNLKNQLKTVLYSFWGRNHYYHFPVQLAGASPSQEICQLHSLASWWPAPHNSWWLHPAKVWAEFGTE